jgi:hypothetical protein
MSHPREEDMGTYNITFEKKSILPQLAHPREEDKGWFEHAMDKMGAQFEGETKNSLSKGKSLMRSEADHSEFRG